MKFKQFIVLGPPGIGVKEQAIALAKRWHIPAVSIDELIQRSLGQDSATGAEVRNCLEAGTPISDALAVKLIRQRFEQPDVMLQGWVLYGFPATPAQAQAFEELSAAFGRPPATVIHLKAMMGLLIDRLWTEGGQKETTVEIHRRLSRHQEAIAPVLAYYRQRSQLTTVNGSLPFAEVACKLAQLGYEPAEAARLIKTEAELDRLLAQKSPLVVDGMAAWCGACKQVTPLIDQLADTYGDRISVMKMDFDANQQVPKRFGLKGMPAVMFFKDGELRETLTGVKPYQAYSAAVTQLLEEPAPITP